jgi:hypothetical protein
MMRQGRGRPRSLLAGVVAGAAVLFVGTVPAPAQAPPALPVITIEGPWAPFREAWVDCDGVRRVAHLSEGYAPVVRDDTGVVDPVPVEVGVSYTGDLADDLEDPVSSESVGPQGEYSSIGLDTVSGATGTLTVTLEPGAGYVLGEPSSGSFTLTDDVHTLADCTAPLALMWGAADQRIAVGEQPGELGVTLFGFDELRVVGTLPPGLTLDEDALWVGTATTPGTYAFQVVHCPDTIEMFPELPRLLCSGTADVQIVVEGPPGSTPPDPSTPSAPAATPVSAAARLTG